MFPKGCQFTIPYGLIGTPWKVLVLFIDTNLLLFTKQYFYGHHWNTLALHVSYTMKYSPNKNGVLEPQKMEVFGR